MISARQEEIMSGVREGENASYSPDGQVLHLPSWKGGFYASVQPHAFRPPFLKV